ncbi:Hypothetical protein DPCES_0856 [Desulfitobacterium hafniense]|uniref:Uncharacterized protein n=1 Tax=Desulfitobacterium hafniense TaxID=49338 RepID=A0A098AVX2_DESHA|nr:hypothetical protein [Desulfitobacterium hafniense]CDX00743.1 Hypothetical protein DPCES_0856 [Desulfitobacterium hafniense]
MTRYDKIKSMSVEEVAQVIMDKDITDAFCKGSGGCDWSTKLEEIGEKECLKCCVEWLNAELGEVASSAEATD